MNSKIEELTRLTRKKWQISSGRHGRSFAGFNFHVSIDGKHVDTIAPHTITTFADEVCNRLEQLALDERK